MLKILILFSSVGIGETLIHQKSGLTFTAVEIIPKLAIEYNRRFPDTTIIIGDAYEYLYNNYTQFDIILASPPCQSYSRLAKINNPNLQPDNRIIDLIKFLRTKYTGNWLVENVDAPFLRQIVGWTKIGRHLFWSNKPLKNQFVYPLRTFRFDKQTDADPGLTATQTYIKRLQNWLGVKLDKNIYIRGNHDPGQIYREGIHPQLMKYIFEQLW